VIRTLCALVLHVIATALAPPKLQFPAAAAIDEVSARSNRIADRHHTSRTYFRRRTRLVQAGLSR
jgi:hypothetical protein